MPVPRLFDISSKFQTTQEVSSLELLPIPKNNRESTRPDRFQALGGSLIAQAATNQ
jgi:hypothetical protein